MCTGYDHMPYLPFPPTWPVYCPARKLANWLESYASILELPVWLSTTAELVSRDPSGKGWMVDVNKDGTKRRLMTRHVVFAVGYGAGLPSIPTYPGQVRTYHYLRELRY
jgi:cation diffusion facilitator CzcD-associated flavoprotein CzcO